MIYQRIATYEISNKYIDFTTPPVAFAIVFFDSGYRLLAGFTFDGQV